MTEATKRYIPEINAVDGFSPAEFTRELPSDDGTTSLYMDVKFRLLWFRLHRPNGKVEPELVSVDDKSAVVCCKIFNDRSDASDQFVAKSYAQRFRSDEKFGDRFLEVAETAAVGRALASAGYLCLEPQLLKDTCMFLHQELAFLIPNHTFRTFHLLVEVLLLSQEKFQHFLLLLQPNSLRRTFQFYLPFRILLEIRYCLLCGTRHHQVQHQQSS